MQLSGRHWNSSAIPTSIPVVGGCRYPCQSIMTTCSTIFPYQHHLCWYHIQNMYKLLCIAISVVLLFILYLLFCVYFVFIILFFCTVFKLLRSSRCSNSLLKHYTGVSPVRQGSQFLATENAGDASEVNILEGYSRSTPRYLSHRISGHTRCHTLSMIS